MLKWLHCVLATLYGPHDHLRPSARIFRRHGGQAVQEQKQGKDEFSSGVRRNGTRSAYVNDQIEAILAPTQFREYGTELCGQSARHHRPDCGAISRR